VTDSQCARVLSVLADGKPHTVPDIHRRAGTMRLNSRVADLRKQGHNIVCERVPGRKGAGAYRYTWLDAPADAANLEETSTGQFTISTDEIAPRVESQRYRLFRVANGGPPEIVATVGTREALGVALCTLGAEGEWDDYCVGVMDALDHQDAHGKWIGKWLVRPWQKGL
jgi:hypothetical protein